MKIQARKALLPTLAVCGAAALIGIASSGSAVAATATTTMPVSLTIAAGCVTTATSLAFGTANVLAASIYQQSTINVTCTNTTAYTIGLDVGAHVSGTQRTMLGGVGQNVAYNLWQDSGHLTAWGTIGTAALAGTGTGVLQPITVWGEVIAQTSPTPGPYADVVGVTVTY
jgi:spore coat protein U-like protein